MGAIFLVLMSVLLAFSVFINFYYYNSAKQYISSRLNMVSGMLSQYYADNPSSFTSEVRSIVENWSDKNRMELMTVSGSGQVSMTSSGFAPTFDVLTQDYYDALKSGSSGTFTGRLPSGEKVIAISIVTPDTAGEFSVIRIMASTARIDRHIASLIIIAAVTFGAILSLMMFSGMYFVKSIVLPVRQLGATARRYARGDFSVRMPVQSDDEIGELCEIINKMADELSQSEAMRNEFISGVSHELRTPLTAIKGWAETIGSMPDDSETIVKGMRVITSETERLSEMVEELLDFSRMQNGKFTLTKGNVDILAELGDAVLIYTEKAKKEGIELVYAEPEDLPAVYGDRNRLRQVFINVIDNAIKYSEKGGLVTVQAILADENRIEIEVSDTGCGISPEDLPKIKTKFFRANHNKRGSGIGLAVADEIITMHSGTLEVFSEQGMGTTVVIMLPVKK
ncbi:MAG: HAMP domain-containing sensor histidine kinase [Oscillospiraceae bacterium]|nr:HAMP domain-containing histidine kinase [Oscillospiraceae bacterium]MCI7498930.1 HAMP domain-containing histidine kinase [Oscillospiraceae bacterium]MDD7278083.1 HAMP domain-containing sensor histidine kinase [Oscillospiraceae bacterium]MDY2863554.1 HAMP domain-containing sensor histidine kinase [Oscillospiraceae bacterium]